MQGNDTNRFSNCEKQQILENASKSSIRNAGGCPCHSTLTNPINSVDFKSHASTSNANNTENASQPLEEHHDDRIRNPWQEFSLAEHTSPGAANSSFRPLQSFNGKFNTVSEHKENKEIMDVLRMHRNRDILPVFPDTALNDVELKHFQSYHPEQNHMLVEPRNKKYSMALTAASASTITAPFEWKEAYSNGKIETTEKSRSEMDRFSSNYGESSTVRRNGTCFMETIDFEKPFGKNAFLNQTHSCNCVQLKLVSQQDSCAYVSYLLAENSALQKQVYQLHQNIMRQHTMARNMNLEEHKTNYQPPEPALHSSVWIEDTLPGMHLTESQKNYLALESHKDNPTYLKTMQKRERCSPRLFWGNALPHKSELVEESDALCHPCEATYRCTAIEENKICESANIENEDLQLLESTSGQTAEIMLRKCNASSKKEEFMEIKPYNCTDATYKNLAEGKNCISSFDTCNGDVHIATFHDVSEKATDAQVFATKLHQLKNLAAYDSVAQPQNNKHSTDVTAEKSIGILVRTNSPIQCKFNSDHANSDSSTLGFAGVCPLQKDMSHIKSNFLEVGRNISSREFCTNKKTQLEVALNPQTACSDGKLSDAFPIGKENRLVTSQGIKEWEEYSDSSSTPYTQDNRPVELGNSRINGDQVGRKNVMQHNAARLCGATKTFTDYFNNHSDTLGQNTKSLAFGKELKNVIRSLIYRNSLGESHLFGDQNFSLTGASEVSNAAMSSHSLCDSNSAASSLCENGTYHIYPKPDERQAKDHGHARDVVPAVTSNSHEPQQLSKYLTKSEHVPENSCNCRFCSKIFSSAAVEALSPSVLNVKCNQSLDCMQDYASNCASTQSEKHSKAALFSDAYCHDSITTELCPKWVTGGDEACSPSNEELQTWDASAPLSAPTHIKKENSSCYLNPLLNQRRVEKDGFSIKINCCFQSNASLTDST